MDNLAAFQHALNEVTEKLNRDIQNRHLVNGDHNRSVSYRLPDGMDAETAQSVAKAITHHHRMQVDLSETDDRPKVFVVTIHFKNQFKPRGLANVINHT